MFVSSIGRLIWQVAWVVKSFLWQETGYKLFALRKHKPKKKQHTPIFELMAVPEMFLLFSCIQIKMWFVHLWGMNCHVDMFQDMITYSMKLFMAIGILFFRKPPDIYVQFDDVIIGAQRRCLMDYLFTWIQWRKEMSADETELGRTMRKEVSQQEKLCAFMAQQENDMNKESSWSSDAFPIVIDTAASKTVTPCFQDLIDPVEYKSSLNGIGQGAITHHGKIRWTVVDDAGKQVILEDDEAYFSASALY